MKYNGKELINKAKNYLIKNKIVVSIIVISILFISIISGGSIYSYNYNKNKKLISDFESYIKDAKSILNKCVIESKDRQEVDDKFRKSQDFIKNKDVNSINNIKNEIQTILNDILTSNKKLVDKSEKEISGIDTKELSDEDKSYIENQLKLIKNNISEKEYKKANDSLIKLKEYIDNKIKQKEEEKKKEEEEKKEEEKQNEENNINSEDTDTGNENSVVGKTYENSTNTNPTRTNTEMAPQPQQSFVANLRVAQQTDQILAVVGNGGSSATVSLHNKVNGIWREEFRVNGKVGYNGISYNSREGEGKTPAGVYSFGIGFGIAGNPGSNIGYRQVAANDYWVDDVNSPYYNKWVSTAEVAKTWNSAEHLIDEQVAYKYAAVINYNTNCVPGAGSAIFLHCIKGNATGGCVAVPESTMIHLLQCMNSGTRIVIATSSSDIYNY